MNNICNNFTEVVLKTFNDEVDKVNNLEKKIKQKDLEIKNLLGKITSLETTNLDLINKADTLSIKNKDLESKNAEISDEITNLNKVSLLKNMHLKYDKMKNKNEVLKKRINYYKKKALNQISKEDIVDLTSISSEQDDIVNIILSTEEEGKVDNSMKKDFVIKKEKTDIIKEEELDKEDLGNINEGESKKDKGKGDIEGDEEENEVENEVEEYDEDEVEVELVKINRRYYYVEDSDAKTVYKAIKIKKGEYDIGDKLGYLKDNKIIKD